MRGVEVRPKVLTILDVFHHASEPSSPPRPPQPSRLVVGGLLLLFIDDNFFKLKSLDLTDLGDSAPNLYHKNIRRKSVSMYVTISYRSTDVKILRDHSWSLL